jgi:hypothetical protein
MGKKFSSCRNNPIICPRTPHGECLGQRDIIPCPDEENEE